MQAAPARSLRDHAASPSVQDVAAHAVDLPRHHAPSRDELSLELLSVQGTCWLPSSNTNPGVPRHLLCTAQECAGDSAAGYTRQSLVIDDSIDRPMG